MNVEFHPGVLKQLQKLPRDVLEAALHAIIALTKAPRPSGARKLVGRNDWRVRIGQSRIVYEIDDAESIIRIFVVAKRSDGYRRAARWA